MNNTNSIQGILHNVTKTSKKRRSAKMPIFYCTCGNQILILPDLPVMITAITNHIGEHRQITGESLTEEMLTQRIIEVLSRTIKRKVYQIIQFCL